MKWEQKWLTLTHCVLWYKNGIELQLERLVLELDFQRSDIIQKEYYLDLFIHSKNIKDTMVKKKEFLFLWSLNSSRLMESREIDAKEAIEHMSKMV